MLLVAPVCVSGHAIHAPLSRDMDNISPPRHPLRSIFPSRGRSVLRRGHTSPGRECGPAPLPMYLYGCVAILLLVIFLIEGLILFYHISHFIYQFVDPFQPSFPVFFPVSLCNITIRAIRIVQIPHIL